VVDFSKIKPSKNFIDLTAINPYLDALLQILTSPTRSRQSTDNKPNGKFPELNPGFSDPHDDLKRNVKMDHKSIMSWLVNDYLMKVNNQSKPKGEPLYDGLADGTYPSQ
jgi:hypothetical protein